MSERSLVCVVANYQWQFKRACKKVTSARRVTKRAKTPVRETHTRLWRSLNLRRVNQANISAALLKYQSRRHLWNMRPLNVMMPELQWNGAASESRWRAFRTPERSSSAATHKPVRSTIICFPYSNAFTALTREARDVESVYEMLTG